MLIATSSHSFQRSFPTAVYFMWVGSPVGDRTVIGPAHERDYLKTSFFSIGSLVRGMYVSPIRSRIVTTHSEALAPAPI